MTHIKRIDEMVSPEQNTKPPYNWHIKNPITNEIVEDSAVIGETEGVDFDFETPQEAYDAGCDNLILYDKTPNYVLNVYWYADNNTPTDISTNGYMYRMTRRQMEK